MSAPTPASFQSIRPGYLITTDPAKLDFAYVHHYLSTLSYWSPNVPYETVQRAAENSLPFGLYQADGQQRGYARVISDYTTYAYLADVFIDESCRGQGLGKWLIATIMQHPNLQGLRRWSLVTADAHELYRQFGWRELARPERYMEYSDFRGY